MAQSGHADRAQGCPLLGVKRTSRKPTRISAYDPQEPSCTDGGDLLCRNMIGADYVTPKLDLALEQRAGSLGRFLIVRVKIHAAVVKRLAQLGVGEAGAQCSVQLVDDRTRRPGRCQQHMPEIDI